MTANFVDQFGFNDEEFSEHDENIKLVETHKQSDTADHCDRNDCVLRRVFGYVVQGSLRSWKTWKKF